MKRVAILLSALTLTSSSAWSAGSLSGHITNDSGTPVPYVQVTWGGLCPAGFTPGHAYTDVNGYWTSPTLPNAKYSVSAGSSPCAKTVYLCGSSNTKTVISNADVSGVDFKHDLELISGTLSGGGFVGITIGSAADRPSVPSQRDVYSQTVPCGDTISVAVNPDPGYIVASVTVDGVAQQTWTFTWNNNQASHTVSATFSLMATTGACCSPSLTCSVMTPQQCAQSGGYFEGYGSPCAPEACYPVRAKASSWGKLKAIYR